MTKTYLLIDLQNRQPAPEQVASRMGTNGEAWIFFGEQEIGLLAKYLELGSQVTLVDISKPGKNSLDFHLLLYLGYLVGRREPGARFVIVAADGDYDPAVVHARLKGIDVDRLEALGPPPIQSMKEAAMQGSSVKASLSRKAADRSAAAAMPATQKSKRTKSAETIYSEILRDFEEAGKPKTLAALNKRIQWRFGPALVPDKVVDVMLRLEGAGAFTIIDGTLRYADRPEK